MSLTECLCFQVALVGGGHTLGRAHGNCPNAGMFDACNGEFTTTVTTRAVPATSFYPPPPPSVRTTWSHEEIACDHGA